MVPLAQVMMPGLLEAQVWRTKLWERVEAEEVAKGPVTLNMVDHLLVPPVQVMMPDQCLNKEQKWLQLE